MQSAAYAEIYADVPALCLNAPASARIIARPHTSQTIPCRNAEDPARESSGSGGGVRTQVHVQLLELRCCRSDRRLPWTRSVNEIEASIRWTRMRDVDCRRGMRVQHQHSGLLPSAQSFTSSFNFSLFFLLRPSTPPQTARELPAAHTARLAAVTKFIEPRLHPQPGSNWIHEAKHDGYRLNLKVFH